MDTRRIGIDGGIESVARRLAETTGRRRVLRLLAGGALGALVGWPVAEAASAHDALATCSRFEDKKKRKACVKKAKKHNRTHTNANTCPAGRRVGSVNVPGNGTTVSTPVLAQGQRYRLRASGAAATNATRGQDAEYDFPFANPSDLNNVIDSVQGTDIGVSIDGQAPDWGPYNVAHVYEREVVGQGRALSLKLVDIIYTDNSGSLTIEIFCA